MDFSAVVALGFASAYSMIVLARSRRETRPGPPLAQALLPPIENRQAPYGSILRIRFVHPVILCGMELATVYSQTRNVSIAKYIARLPENCEEVSVFDCPVVRLNSN